jgi:hypothetical protein
MYTKNSIPEAGKMNASLNEFGLRFLVARITEEGKTPVKAEVAKEKAREKRFLTPGVKYPIS